MAQSDWAEAISSISTSSMKRNVSAFSTPPAGGGNYTFGMHVLDATVAGAAALYVDLAGFTPTGSGPGVADGSCSLTGCMQRQSGAGYTGHTPFMFVCGQGAPVAVSSWAYRLCLSDEDPYRIILDKALLTAQGISTSTQTLATSSSSFSLGDALWHHLRIDAAVQANGEVLLQAYSSDLSARPIGHPSGPSWQSISGIPAVGIVDDANLILTGTPPLLGGYLGFGMACTLNALNRRAAFDAFEPYRVL